MKMIYLLIILIPLMGNCDLVAGAIQSNDTMVVEEVDDNDLDALRMTETRCFQFTWLGPSYTYENWVKNTTCDSLLNAAKGIPCIAPLWVTNNSMLPNTTEMWETDKLNFTCRLVDGDVCAKYSYFYNGAVENITYMCTKVRIENGDPVTSGCFQEINGGRMVEVCACRSLPGYPCNSADTIVMTFLEFVVKVMFLIFFLSVVR